MHGWWTGIAYEFTGLMLGRYLWDGLGAEPLPADTLLRGLKVISAAKRSRHLKDIEAMVEMVDRARRKSNADAVRH